MKTFTGEYLENFIHRNINLIIILIFNIAIIILALIFYPLMPVLMRYPPDFIRVSIELGASYTGQYIFIILSSIIVGTIILLLTLKGIDGWKNELEKSGDERESAYLIKKIRRKYINVPYVIFVVQFLCLVPLIIISVFVRVSLNAPIISLCKVLVIAASLNYLASVFSYTFSKKLLTDILLKKYRGQSLEGYRISLKNKIFIQVIPLVIVSIMFTSLLGYSQLIKEKGNLLYLLCKSRLAEQIDSISHSKNPGEVFNILKKISVEGFQLEYFIVNPQGEIVKAYDNLYTDHYNYYIRHPRKGDRVYGDTEEIQGVVARVNTGFGPITAGIRFYVVSRSMLWILFLGFIALLGVTIFILYHFSKGIVRDIDIVAASINEIAEGKEVDLRKRIPVTSNDEIGDLVAAFNRIRKREYEYENLRNEFFSNISHELRTPINIILSTIQLVERYLIGSSMSAENVKLKKHMGIINKNGFRLLRLVNNIIDSTKIDVSTFKVNLRNWDIVKLVGEITGSVSEYIREKGLSIEFQSNVSEMIIACDQELIERIILNLLSNAVKFTGEGGSIDVGVYAVGEYINISVKDNGIGIEQDKFSIIFERFGQVEQTLRRSHEGSGIGLSLVKTFVEMNGGTISVNSEFGKGSEFIVRLPIRMLPDTEESSGNGEKIDKGVEMISIELADVK